MKKILTVLMFLLIFCSVCFADMTAGEKAYFRAKEPSDNPLVGLWKAIPAFELKRPAGNNSAECYYALFPAPDDRPEWDYIMIALGDIFAQKAGDTLALLRKTEHANVYFIKYVTSNHLGSNTAYGPVIYNDGYFDFRGVGTDGTARFPMLLKADGHIIPEFEDKYPLKKDELWGEMLTPVK